MTSQLSQPSASISAREVGRTGAVPKRSAQCLRRANNERGTSSGETGTKPLRDDDGGPGAAESALRMTRGVIPRSPGCGMLERMGLSEQRQYPRLGLGLPVTLLFLGRGQFE